MVRFSRLLICLERGLPEKGRTFVAVSFSALRFPSALLGLDWQRNAGETPGGAPGKPSCSECSGSWILEAQQACGLQQGVHTELSFLFFPLGNPGGLDIQDRHSRQRRQGWLAWKGTISAGFLFWSVLLARPTYTSPLVVFVLELVGVWVLFPASQWLLISMLSSAEIARLRGSFYSCALKVVHSENDGGALTGTHRELALLSGLCWSQLEHCNHQLSIP